MKQRRCVPVAVEPVGLVVAVEPVGGMAVEPVVLVVASRGRRGRRAGRR